MYEDSYKSPILNDHLWVPFHCIEWIDVFVKFIGLHLVDYTTYTIGLE